MMQITGNLYFDAFYDTFSKEELLKIKTFIRNNINNFEILFAPFVYEPKHEPEHISYHIAVFTN